MTTGLAVGQANAILDALCKSVAYSDPAAFYVKLHLGDPGSAGSANAAANTTRQAATFASASGGASTTSADLVWTNVSNTETYAYVSFWSAVTSGTFLGSDALTAARAVTAGDTFTIPAGDVSLALTPIAA
jgi:hypothetical protein